MSSPLPSTIIDLRHRVCIIGAGPAGLSMARALKRQGIAYDQIEKHADVGGLWDADNPGSPMYRNCHFVSSKTTSGFHDVPMPAHFADYPHNRDILAYTRAFARRFGLYDAIRFNAPARDVRQDGDTWLVTLSSGEVFRYRAVICCTGALWEPNLPLHPGEFNGQIRHTVTYKDPEEFRGKRVMIIGAGNSGADIACDAAANADRAFISLRRGYHIIPKHVFGVPADEFSAKGPKLPRWLERPIFTFILRHFLVGDVTRWGLPKPDHKLFETHPLLNTQMLHYLQHGDLRAKGAVERFDGDHVVFVDGSRERIDLVLYATGYRMGLPFVPREYFDWSPGGRPELYLRAFNRKHRNLFAILVDSNGSTFTLFDEMTHLIANYLHDQTANPSRAATFDQLIRTDEPDLSGGLKFVQSNRHEAGYVDDHAYRAYLGQLRKRMNWPALRPGYFNGMEVVGDVDLALGAAA